MTQKLEAIEHQTRTTSRPATPRPSSESYVEHLRSISRLSLEAELLNLSPASLSPASTPRLGSPAGSRPGTPVCHREPRHESPFGMVREPYKPAPAMVASHSSRDGFGGSRTASLSTPSSQPCTPTTEPATEPVAISPSLRPTPRRVWTPDVFANRTRWSKAKTKRAADRGYCCGLCDERPEALALCGSWLTGTITPLVAGISMACCAAALK